jgi:hypothetical protein
MRTALLTLILLLTPVSVGSECYDCDRNPPCKALEACLGYPACVCYDGTCVPA